MTDYRLISSDSHVTMPDDAWQEYLDPEFRDRAPGVERTDEGDAKRAYAGAAVIPDTRLERAHELVRRLGAAGPQLGLEIERLLPSPPVPHFSEPPH